MTVCLVVSICNQLYVDDISSSQGCCLLVFIILHCSLHSQRSLAGFVNFGTALRFTFVPLPFSHSRLQIYSLTHRTCSSNPILVPESRTGNSMVRYWFLSAVIAARVALNPIRPSELDRGRTGASGEIAMLARWRKHDASALALTLVVSSPRAVYSEMLYLRDRFSFEC